MTPDLLTLSGHHGDPLPQLEVVNPWPELDDLSRSFEPRRERESELDLVLASYDEVVGEVDAGCRSATRTWPNPGAGSSTPATIRLSGSPNTVHWTALAWRIGSLSQYSLRDHRRYSGLLSRSLEQCAFAATVG